MVGAREGLLTDGVWAGAVRLLDSAHRSIFLIALGVPTQTKGIPLFRLLWLLGGGVPRLSTEVAVDAIATLGRLSLQPEGSLGRDLHDSWAPPGTAFASIRRRRAGWGIPPLAPPPEGRQPKPWLKKYRQMAQERLFGRREAPWWKENVVGREHDLFISRAGGPGEWLARVQASSQKEEGDPEKENWGEAVAAARILLGAGAAESWVATVEGQKALRGELEQRGMSPPAEACVVAWAAGGKGADEGHGVWDLFRAAKRTLWMAPDRCKRGRAA